MKKLMLCLGMSFLASAIFAQHAVGEKYGGGIVFYVYDNGAHGLIAATLDQSTGIQWSNGTNKITAAAKNGIGAGGYNTGKIIASQGAGNYAASICAQYRGGNYKDWYLPSAFELNLLKQQKDVVGGFSDGHYWSSCEAGVEYASFMAFGFGFQADYKYTTNYVRAVRAF